MNHLTDLQRWNGHIEYQVAKKMLILNILMNLDAEIALERRRRAASLDRAKRVREALDRA